MQNLDYARQNVWQNEANREANKASIGHKSEFDLRAVLACPACKSPLIFAPGLIECKGCHAQLPQVTDRWFDLLPPYLQEDNPASWETRQVEMEQWYKGILDDPAAATVAFEYEYEPYRPLLADLAGVVLDLGGGNGIVRHYLPDNLHYVSLDPSLDWLGVEWRVLEDSFPCLAKPLPFVRGVGEHLPFAAHSFDAVLAFWSLNHTHRPADVVHEVHRVLRPGGRFVLVLEDMEPAWLDFAYFHNQYQAHGLDGLRDDLMSKLGCEFGSQGWPLQSDHLRIREADLEAWCTGYFTTAQRAWYMQFLTFDLVSLA